MLKHTLFMGISTVLRLLTGVVVFIFLARAWGPEKFGVFMHALTLTTLLSLVVDYGFTQQLMRDVARAPEHVEDFLARVFSAKFLLMAAMILIFFGILFTVARDGEERILLIILLAGCMISSFAETYIVVFRGLGKFHHETVIMAWVNFLYLGGIVALLWAGVGVIGIGLSILFSRLVFIGLCWRVYRQLLPASRFRLGSRQEGIAAIRAGFSFAAESAFTNFQAQVDTLIVNHFLGSAAVGVYQAGLRLMQGANSFALVLSNVYLPAMCQHLHDAPASQQLASRLFLQMLGIGTVCMLIFSLGGEWITHWLYGAKYEQLVPLMPWFGFVLLLRYIAASYGVTLSAYGLQKSRVVAIAIALTVLFTATAVLIPRHGLLGMLMASAMAVACLAVVYIANLARRQFPCGATRINAIAGMAVLMVSVTLLKII